MQSRVIWYAISNLCVPLRLRAGLWQYQLTDQFITRLPIPAMTDADRATLGTLAMEITDLARTRYALHGRVRHRLHSDFGALLRQGSGGQAPEKKLNQKLTAWWTLDFPALRAEVQKVFKRDIPLKERDEVEAWHAAQRNEHARLTGEIVKRETDLNARVYALFGLTDEEIVLIEASTKYRYGEV